MIVDKYKDLDTLISDALDLIEVNPDKDRVITLKLPTEKVDLFAEHVEERMYILVPDYISMKDKGIINKESRTGTEFIGPQGIKVILEEI